MWTFLNVIQILNYVPALSLDFPTNVITMFGFLNIAN